MFIVRGTLRETHRLSGAECGFHSAPLRRQRLNDVFVATNIRLLMEPPSRLTDPVHNLFTS